MGKILSLRCTVEHANVWNRRAIHNAAIFNNFVGIQALLDNGANINPQDEDGNTPLILSSFDYDDRNRTEMLSKFLENGANINLKNYGNDTALSVVMTKKVYGNFQNETSILRSIIDDSFDAMDFLIQNGGTYSGECFCQNQVAGESCPTCPTCEFHDLTTPAINGNLECVNYQVFERADTNKFEGGSSILYKAVHNGHVEIAEILANDRVNHTENLIWEPVADLNAKTENGCVSCNREGDSSLHEAVIKGFDQITKILVDNNADVEIQNFNYNNSRPVHVAGQFGRINSLEILVNDGNADIDAKDSNNSTCVFYAVSKGNFDMVNSMINLGANLNLINKNGETATGLAKKLGFDNIFELLHNSGGRENGVCGCLNGPSVVEKNCQSDNYCETCDSGFYLYNNECFEFDQVVYFTIEDSMVDGEDYFYPNGIFNTSTVQAGSDNSCSAWTVENWANLGRNCENSNICNFDMVPSYAIDGVSVVNSETNDFFSLSSDKDCNFQVSTKRDSVGNLRFDFLVNAVKIFPAKTSQFGIGNELIQEAGFGDAIIWLNDNIFCICVGECDLTFIESMNVGEFLIFQCQQETYVSSVRVQNYHNKLLPGIVELQLGYKHGF